MTEPNSDLVRSIKPAFTDERGSITDILENQPITHVTLITSRKDAVRGNHYHEDTTQYVYLVRGRMLYISQYPGGEVQRVVMSAGDMVVTRPTERHAMRALEDDTAFLAMTVGPRGGADFEADTYRLDPANRLE